VRHLRRRGSQRRGLGVHEHREAVAAGIPGDGQILAVCPKDHHPATAGRRRLRAGLRVERFVVVEEQRLRGRDARHVVPRREVDGTGGAVVDAAEVEGVGALGREGGLAVAHAAMDR
jgi:hypothetical protein